MGPQVYSPGAAWWRVLSVAAILGAVAWFGWLRETGPQPMDSGTAFVLAISRGVFFVVLLCVPFVLRDLLEAIRFDRTRRQQERRARTPTGRHDTGMAAWWGRGDAPDNWQ